MPAALIKYVFSSDLLPLTQNFSCGKEEWHLELNRWIKAPLAEPGALTDMQRSPPAEVWLHFDENDRLVGYSSLAESKWKLIEGSKKRRTISLIPNIAVQAEEQGKGYFSQMLEHLKHEALHRPGREPVLGLYVDPRNRDAIDKYQKKGDFSLNPTIMLALPVTSHVNVKSSGLDLLLATDC